MKYDYKDAGVDVEAGYKAVELIKTHVAKTVRKEVLGGLGGFGAMFSIAKAKEMQDPVLVSGTDGVGTKLKIAFLMDKHDTIGIDCVAMCVNDIICCGAEPLFFLDYIACGRNEPQKIEEIVKGITKGCILSGASLIGGETAEMPGFYQVDEYDLAGFCVGIVDKPNIIDGKNIKPGDKIIGLASSGLHSNGFSLVRRIMSPTISNINKYIDALSTPLGDTLIEPTKIYVKPILDTMKKYPQAVKGIANITGGGFYENIPRMLPEGVGIKINAGTWNIPEIFQLLKKMGNVDDEMMYNTFNMGIGMVMAVSPDDCHDVMGNLIAHGETVYEIGQVSDSGGLFIC